MDELIDIMLEIVYTARTTVRIAVDDYPTELVKAKFIKLDSEHIRFVLDCMQENTTKICNMKKYYGRCFSMLRPPSTATTLSLSPTIWQI